MLRKASTFTAAILCVGVAVAQNNEDGVLADVTVAPVIPIDGPTPSFAPSVPSPVQALLPIDALPDPEVTNEFGMAEETAMAPGGVQATATATPPTGGSGGMMGPGDDSDGGGASAAETPESHEDSVTGPVGGFDGIDGPPGGTTPEPVDAGVDVTAVPGEDGTGSGAAAVTTGGQDATATTGGGSASVSGGEDPAATDAAPETTDDGDGFQGVGTGGVAPGAGAGAGATDSPMDVGAMGTETSDAPSEVDDPSSTEEASPDSDSDLPGIDDDGLDTSPSESAEADDDEVCFPALATVELEDGSFKTMRDLQIGDKVRVNANEFSPVFMFTHRLSDHQEHFVEITTQAGATIRATKNHYIPTADNHLVAAGSLKRGDTLFLADGSRTPITSLRSVRDTGLYNPQTLHGDVVVNGVVASTFTKTVQPTLAKALLAPLRASFSYFGVSLSFFETGSSGLAKLVPRGNARVSL